MIGWFTRWLERLVQLGLDLAAALIAGLFRAPVTAAQRATRPVDVRPASPEEVIDVRHRVLRTARPRATAIFDGDEATETRHWVAQSADLVVGVASVMAADEPDAAGEPARWQLRGMAVLPEWRDRQLGVSLLREAQLDVNAPHVVQRAHRGGAVLCPPRMDLHRRDLRHRIGGSAPAHAVGALTQGGDGTLGARDVPVVE